MSEPGSDRSEYPEDELRSGVCDRCYRNRDGLVPVVTIMDGVEQKEWVCEGCEPEAREDEKPPLRADGSGEPGTERLHVDLCTGLGGWKEPFEDADGWTSIGVDIRDDLNADVVADVRNLPLECSPDLLTMSPPCTEFSRYSMPWLDEPNPSTELVEACLQAVEDLEPDWWVLENVRGLKQYWGRPERKRVGPFYLWGEFPTFDVRLADGSGKMQTSGESPEERAKIPYEIGDAVRRSVEVYDGA